MHACGLDDQPNPGGVEPAGDVEALPRAGLLRAAPVASDRLVEIGSRVGLREVFEVREVWAKEATGRFGPHDIPNGGSSWNVVWAAGGNFVVAGTGDYDGDGTDDVLWYDRTNGNVGQYVMSNGQATWRPLDSGGGNYESLVSATDADAMLAA